MENTNKKPLLMIVGILVILIVVIIVGVVLLQIGSQKDLTLNMTVNPTKVFETTVIPTTNSEESTQVTKSELDAKLSEIDTLLKDVNDLDSSLQLENSDIIQ